MGPPLIPPGPGITGPAAPILQSFYDALVELRNPSAPSQLVHIDTKADLLKLPPENYKGTFAICDEINSIVHSALSSGSWVWLRADGSAL